jgi:small subunit ribosomal protein S17
MAKTIVGVVTSNKSAKTIVITATSRKTHPIYRKQYSVNTKYMAHDEKEEANIGDTVSIIECSPISARKRFTLSKVIERPSISQDKLAVTKIDDTNKKASKSKAKEEEASEPSDSKVKEKTK